jgi:hypothetical protein
MPACASSRASSAPAAATKRWADERRRASVGSVARIAAT